MAERRVAIETDENGNSVRFNTNTLPGWLANAGHQASNGLRNFFLDASTNNANFGGWLTGGDQSWTPRRIAEQQNRDSGNASSGLFRARGTWDGPAGQRTPDDDPPRTGRRVEGPNAQLERLGRGRGQVAGAGEEAPKSFQDFLAEAMGITDQLGIGKGGVDYSGVRNGLNTRAADADGKIAALARAAQAQLETQQPEIQASYDSADQQINDAADTAVGNIQAGYQSARADALQGYQALGIANEGPSAAELQGAEDQGFQTAGAESTRQLFDSHNEGARQNALSTNRGFQDAAVAQGQQGRTQLSYALSQALAQADLAEQQQNAQLGSSRSQAILGLAQNLFGGYQDGLSAQEQARQDALEAAREQGNIDRQYGLDVAKTEASLAPRPLTQSDVLDFIRGFDDPNDGWNWINGLTPEQRAKLGL